MIETTILAIIFGIGLLAIARMYKHPMRSVLTFLDGITWLFVAVEVFWEYDAGWLIIFTALGIIILYDGATELMTWKE
jgi:hypothetical protein